MMTQKRSTCQNDEWVTKRSNDSLLSSFARIWSRNQSQPCLVAESALDWACAVDSVIWNVGGQFVELIHNVCQVVGGLTKMFRHGIDKLCVLREEELEHLIWSWTTRKDDLLQGFFCCLWASFDWFSGILLTMRPQLVCCNVSVTCLTIPHSLAGSISSSSHVSTQRWAMARPCRLHPLKGRQVTRLNATVEFKGDLNTEGVAEGLVSSVGTPVTVVSLRDWYLADKQFVVISVSAFVVCCFFSLPFLCSLSLSVFCNQLCGVWWFLVWGSHRLRDSWPFYLQLLSQACWYASHCLS